MEGERKYISLLILLIASLMIGYFGFVWWKKEKQKELEEVSYKAYLIAKNLKEGKYEEGLKLIEEVKENYKGNQMTLFAESYSLLIDNLKEKDKVSENLAKSFKDEDIKSLFWERTAYEKENVKLLERIKEEGFNYYSSLLLKAILLKREGKKKEAERILEELSRKELPYISYTANVLKEKLKR